jgi:hypothetical protein
MPNGVPTAVMKFLRRRKTKYDVVLFDHVVLLEANTVWWWRGLY